MKVKKIITQSRRDFVAVYECEHCGFEKRGYGYDDTNFHHNVIPVMKCDQCGKTARSDYRPLETKYPESTIV